MIRRNEVIKMVKVTFSGLYEWGTGWLSREKMEKWHEFWKSYKGIFWTYAEDNKYGANSGYLFSMHGSIYLHPMGFTVTFTNGCGTVNGLYYGSLTNELAKACKEVAELCGGGVSFEMSDETAVSINLYEVEIP